MSAAPRLSRLYRVAEIILRYRPEKDSAGIWRVWDSEASEPLPADYTDERHAKAGARMAAACAIDELYRPVEGR